MWKSKEDPGTGNFCIATNMQKTLKRVIRGNSGGTEIRKAKGAGKDNI